MSGLLGLYNTVSGRAIIYDYGLAKRMKAGREKLNETAKWVPSLASMESSPGRLSGWASGVAGRRDRCTLLFLSLDLLDQARILQCYYAASPNLEAAAAKLGSRRMELSCETGSDGT